MSGLPDRFWSKVRKTDTCGVTLHLLPSCEDCGGPVDEYGCGDDGHSWCRYCLHNCRACLSNMKDDWHLT